MPLLNDTPLANEQLSVSQGLIRTNFQLLGPCVGGIFNQQAAAGLGTAATELAIYNRVIGAANQLCFRRAGVAPGGAEIVFTDFINTVAAPNNDGSTVLPSGVMIKWGRRSIAAAAVTATINYAGAAFTTLFTRTVAFDATGVMANDVPWGVNTRASVFITDEGAAPALIRVLVNKPHGWNGFVNYIAIGI
jgi:hypothetical protein